MSEFDPTIPPPPPGGYPPPPPPYPVTSDIPPQSPYHYSSAPRQQSNRGLLSWLGSAVLAAWAVIKYGGLLLLKIPAFATLASALVSIGAWSLAYGSWWAGIAVVAMIFVHEMGHVFEIRRQGMHATAPIFIPFLGAAIFQRSHPTDALKQAEIGIAGPIAGTLGASVAFVLYTSTQNPIFLFAALFGFFINLFNLIPVWQLDGAWILAPVSPWVQVFGLVMIGAAVLIFHFVSVILIIIAILGLSTLRSAFRNAHNPYYTSVPASAKWVLGGAWLALVLYLGAMSLQAESLFANLPR
ncbi:MAG TPA: site-2 protease family protein [Candidatus Dormibacteraeota bacterium]|nr:site-2 protease family protein [Candidatus Dormibacteraeota bacterium]